MVIFVTSGGFPYVNFFLIEEEHLPFLFRTLHSLAPKWYGFCLQLGVKELDQIQRNGTSVDDCFVLALQSWLHNGVSCNWKQLITAIFKPAGGGNQRLACDVAESFRGIFTPTGFACTAVLSLCC